MIIHFVSLIYGFLAFLSTFSFHLPPFFILRSLFFCIATLHSFFFTPSSIHSTFHTTFPLFHRASAATSLHHTLRRRTSSLDEGCDVYLKLANLAVEQVSRWSVPLLQTVCRTLVTLAAAAEAELLNGRYGLREEHFTTSAANFFIGYPPRHATPDAHARSRTPTAAHRCRKHVHDLPLPAAELGVVNSLLRLCHRTSNASMTESVLNSFPADGQSAGAFPAPLHPHSAQPCALPSTAQHGNPQHNTQNT